jgi:hypothetical protein
MSCIAWLHFHSPLLTGAEPVGHPGALLAIEPAGWDKAATPALLPQNQQTVASSTASWLRGLNRDEEDTMRAYYTARDRLMAVAQHVMQIAERAVDRTRLRDRQVEQAAHA